MDCCHLHCHSSRSFKDGLTPVNELVDRAAEIGFPALTITEHGNLFSAAQLFQATGKAGIKPIFGMEAYEAVTHQWDLERDQAILARPWDSGRARYYHLTIWVASDVGWRNLCALHSQSYTAPYKPKNQPLIDRASLEKHNEGLMIGVGCMQSRVNYTLRAEGIDAAYEAGKWIPEVFAGRCWFEIMGNLDEQVAMQRDQRKLAAKLGMPTVATYDVHYRDQIDGARHAAHHILVQARRFKKQDTEQSADRSDDGFGSWYGSDEFFLKSPQQMLATTGIQPHEVAETGKVLDLVTFQFGDLPKPKPPLAPIPEPGEDPAFDQWLAMA